MVQDQEPITTGEQRITCAVRCSVLDGSQLLKNKLVDLNIKLKQDDLKGLVENGDDNEFVSKAIAKLNCLNYLRQIVLTIDLASRQIIVVQTCADKNRNWQLGIQTHVRGDMKA